jgi:hypothetical protein
MTARDQKLLAVWLVLAAVTGYVYLAPANTGSMLPASASAETVEMAEQRLARLKDLAAAAPSKLDILTKISAELAVREQGLIRAETVQQAQAQMLAALRELADLEAIEIRSMEMAAVEPFGDGYGLAPVRVQFECRMAQLVNVLAGLAARPELMATRGLQIQASNPKEKTVRVVLNVVGVVPKELVPVKKGAGL